MLGLRYESILDLVTFTTEKSKNSTFLPIKIFTKLVQFCQPLILALCAATAEILFLRGVGTGALLLTAMLLQPAVLLMGITGVIAAVTFAKIAQLGQNYLDRGPFLFNPLLAGLSVGYLFQPGAASLFLAGVAGILAFILTWTLSHIFRTFLFLPVLSLPFIIVSWVVHLAAFRYAGLQPAIIPAHVYSIGLPIWMEGFLRTLGLIFFLPNIWVGIVVAGLLLVNSRIQFLLAIGGYALGTSIRGILTGTFIYVYYDPAALNFVLVALAIGGFYLLPSIRSYAIAGLAIGLVAVLSEAVSVFWAASGLPVHALPYNLVTLLLLYVLGLVGYRWLTRYPQPTPEQTLDYELTARLRYQGTGKTISLPFSGRWLVWQGFHGQWTHQGLWCYAYDFVIQDESGSTYRDDGFNLKDYYAYGKPILSPVRGWIVRVISDLPDCAIGNIDQEHNWGNHIIIYDERGFYVEISHFAQHSITVKSGDRVEIGTLLGRCGNSGYSSQPHIHIQVQLSAELGAATALFSFANLMVDGEFRAEATPSENTILEPVASDRALAKALTFPLDSSFDFTVTQKEKIVDHLSLTTRITGDGWFYLDSGKAKLYFSRDEYGFIFHRLDGNDPNLALLLTAIPRLPLARREPGNTWSDYLPVGMMITGIRQMVYLFASSFVPELASARYTGEWISNETLVGAVTIPGIKNKVLTSATFAQNGEILRVGVGQRSLVRQDLQVVTQKSHRCLGVGMNGSTVG